MIGHRPTNGLDWTRDGTSCLDFAALGPAALRVGVSRHACIYSTIRQADLEIGFLLVRVAATQITGQPKLVYGTILEKDQGQTGG